MTSGTVYWRTNYVLLIGPFIVHFLSLSNVMNMEIFVKEQCIDSVHSVAIYLTLFFFIFSESVTTSHGYRWGYVSYAHFLLYFYNQDALYNTFKNDVTTFA